MNEIDIQKVLNKYDLQERNPVKTFKERGLKLDVSYPKIDQENSCGTHWQHLKIIQRYLKGILSTKLVFERGHMLVTPMPIAHQKLQIGNMLVETYSKYSVMAQQEATNYSYIII